MEPFEKIRDIPVDPKKADEMWLSHISHEEQNEHLMEVTGGFKAGRVPAVVISEMAKTVANGFDWGKKCRIVVEYDPDKGFRMLTFQERGGTDREKGL